MGRSKTETFTLIIPYGVVIFGKTFEMPLECAFERSKDSFITIKSLIGLDNKNRAVYDMLYLVDNDDEVTKHIVSGIMSNKDLWDHGENSWWK